MGTTDFDNQLRQLTVKELATEVLAREELEVEMVELVNLVEEQ